MSPAVLHTIRDVRTALAEARRRGSSIGLVPTMGAMHAGHGALIRRAREECGFVVVSVFVNPLQFDRADDYNRYPRAFASDTAFAGDFGADLIFAPSAQEMYPQPEVAFVDVEQVSEHLCGQFRPGHFRGVATVVTKLFHIVEPDRAYFGEKDGQQLAVIRRMVADLNFPIAIVPVPTVREPDGLALSSRNQRLTPDERRVAPVLYRALCEAQALVARGCTDAAAVKAAALRLLAGTPEVRVEYLEVVEASTQQPAAVIDRPVAIAAAVWLGQTRLIDNVLCQPPTAITVQD